MKVVTYPTAADFWRAAGPLLTADPIRHTTAIGVLSRLLAGARYSDTAPIFLTVHDTANRDTVVGAALCTPPFPIVVTAVPPRAAPAVVDRLLADGFRPAGASGLGPEVEAFQTAWCERTGAGIASRMDQRLYRLGELRRPTAVPGRAVAATDAEIDLVADWYAAFEAGSHLNRPPTGRADLVRQVRDQRALGAAQLIWWLDGEPVSLATVGALHTGMSRIAPVYTPADRRGLGYASAVTAAAAQWGLDQGAEHVLLYTDLANPVSNHVYQGIGFVPVVDAVDVRFTQPG